MCLVVPLPPRANVVIATITLASAAALGCHTPPAAASARTAPSAAIPVNSSAEPASCDGKRWPTDAWNVCISTAARFERPQVDRAQYVANLDMSFPVITENEQNPSFDLSAQRTLCLPKGRYIIHTESDTLIDVWVDGRQVIQDRHAMSRSLAAEPDFSPPVPIDGCVRMRVLYRNYMRFSPSRLRVYWTQAAPARVTCDEASYPRDDWNVCVFEGYHEQLPIGNERWAELKARWAWNEGPMGRADDYSLSARHTICFEPGQYIFRASWEGGFALSVGDHVVMDELQLRPGAGPGPVTRLSEPIMLDGCLPARARYADRVGPSALDVAWARSGTPLAGKWRDEQKLCPMGCPLLHECRTRRSGDPPSPGRDTTGGVCAPPVAGGDIGHPCDPGHPCRTGLACFPGASQWRDATCRIPPRLD
ncbi:MAG: hypothetical protein HY898_17775 [Deltaproteobacteria bacterium]|nr:hypothetical protein [Deltaproteobacteria bacterium]